MNIHDLDTLPLPLTLPDRQTLQSCEAIIAEGLQTFYEVGKALTTIRNQKLYREGFRTFEDYCRDRWQISRPRAYQLIEAAGVIENLSTIVDKPTNEAQARSLSEVPPEHQQTIWEKAITTAPNGKVTAKHIDQVKQTAIPVQDTPKPAASIPNHIPDKQMLTTGWTCSVCQKFFPLGGLASIFPDGRRVCIMCQDDQETTLQEEKSDVKTGGVFYCCHFCSQFFTEAQVYVALNEKQCIRGVICRQCAETALKFLLDPDEAETVNYL